MSKSKGLLIDIGVTLVVFTIAVLILGYTNYRNNSSDLGVDFRQLNTGIVLSELVNVNESVVLITSEDEALRYFPPSNVRVDWEEEVILGYIDSPQPSSGYSLETTSVTRQGPEIDINYRLLFPPAGSTNLTVITQPTMLVVLNRADLATSSQLTVRFRNEISNQTTSLSVNPNEIS